MNAKLIPTLPEECTLRAEADGGFFISGRGFFKPISLSDFELLKAIDGAKDAYSIAKDESKSEVELACHLIRISSMADEGIIELRRNPSTKILKACISKNRPFSRSAFSTPVMVSLAVTGECNRSCQHCYREGVVSNSSFDEDGFYAVVESLSGMDLAILNITGGEPFLYDRIVDLACFAATQINCVTISTNGTLLDKSIIEALAQQNGVIAIQIGLNAVYDTKRGFDIEGCEKVFDSARIAYEEGLRVVIGVVLTANTVEHLADVFRRSSESGVSSIRLGPLIQAHPGCESLQVRPEDVLFAIRNASQLSIEYGIMVQFVDGLADPGVVQANPDERKHYCYLGTGILHIEPDGSIFPCSALLSEEFFIGKLSSRPTVDELIAVWKESKVLQDLREVTIDCLEPCRICSIRSRCGGGCRTAAYWNTGSILGENPFCLIAKGSREY